MESNNKKCKISIVGGSLAGLSAAVSLLKKAFTLPSMKKQILPEKVGLRSWSFYERHIIPNGLRYEFFDANSIEENRDITGRLLNRDENIQYFSTYWRSLYGKLLYPIPKEAILFNNTVIKIDQEGENEIKLWVQTRIGKIFEETTDSFNSCRWNQFYCSILSSWWRRAEIFWIYNIPRDNRHKWPFDSQIQPWQFKKIYKKTVERSSIITSKQATSMPIKDAWT